MDGHIDYSGYSLEQLREAEAGVNRDLYPMNYANLRAELQRRGAPLRTRQAPLQRKPLSRAVILDRLRRVSFGFAWFLFIWWGVGGIVAGVASALAKEGPEPETFREGFTAGKAYGLEFGRKYGLYFFFGGLAIAIAGTAFQVLPGTKRRVAVDTKDHAST